MRPVAWTGDDFRRIAATACAALGLLCWVSAAKAAGEKLRVASINLCADQILAALAPREAIVGLGPFARDPAMSFLAEKANGLPQIGGRLEDITRLSADIVLVGPFDNRSILSMLHRRGVATLTVGRWTRIAEVTAGIEDIAPRIRAEKPGAALVSEIRDALEVMRADVVHDGSSRSFLMVQRRGYVDDGGLVAEILEFAGLRNLAPRSSPKFLDVEAIIALRPHVLVIADPGARAEDRGLELLRHPALDRLYPDSRRISAPDRLTACGGPSTPALIDWLRKEVRRVSQAP